MPVIKNSNIYCKRKLIDDSIPGNRNNGNISIKVYSPTGPKTTPPNQGSSVMPSIKIVGVDKPKK